MESLMLCPPLQKVDGMNQDRELNSIMFEQRIDDIRLKRDDDILLATYPRTGTTWLGQLVSLMLAAAAGEGAGDEKYEATKQIPLHDRVLFLEMKFPGNERAQIYKLDSVPAPRVDKTHLCFRFMTRWLVEDKVRTIVTTRNPKDTLVSHYHFYQNLKHVQFKGTWDQFFDFFVKGDQLVNGDPYAWYEDWAKNQGQGEVLFLQYEAMKQDIVPEIHKIAAFLGLQLSGQHVEKLVHDVNIRQMRADAAVTHEPNAKEGGNFVRSGASGEWKKFFTVEQNEWFDAKYKKLYEALSLDIEYN